MPPLAKANVPPKVIAPAVAVDGVRPVVPALNVETKLPDKELVGIVVEAVTALVPLAYM